MTRVAAVQLAPVVGDLDGNVQRATDALTDVLAAGARIIVLPELTTSGYVFESVEEARSLAIEPSDPVFARWAELLGSAGDGTAVLVVGFAELTVDQLFNSCAVIDASGVRAVYRKVHLWDQEKRFFTPGNAQPPVIETAHGRIGTMICFDLEFPEWSRVAALAGADLLAVPTNWPFVPKPEGERAPEVQIALATARMNHMAIAVADRTGTERGVEWTGGTGVIGADGWMLDAVGTGTGVAWGDIDLPASREKVQAPLVHLFDDRRPDLYGPLTTPHP